VDLRIDKDSPSPIYQQIIDQIKAAILDGSIQASGKLPSERELASRFNINRMTVRRAFERLADSGFIVSKSGKGAFASPPKLDQSVGRLMRFFSDMRERGLRPESKVLSAKKVKPHKEVSDFLFSGEKADVLRVERLLTANGIPYVHEVKFLNYRRCLQLEERDYAIEGNDFKYMDECVRCWITAELCIGIEILSPETVSDLGFGQSRAVFLVKNRVRTFQNKPLSFTFSRYRSDLYTFKLSLSNYPSVNQSITNS